MALAYFLSLSHTPVLYEDGQMGVVQDNILFGYIFSSANVISLQYFYLNPSHVAVQIGSESFLIYKLL